MQIAPYVSDRRKRRKKIRLYLFGALAVFALYFILFGVAWLFMRAPFFRVANVVVTGNGEIPAADVIALAEADPSGRIGFVDSVLSWRNMLAWPDSVPSSALAMAPELSSIAVSKDYFSHTVTLAVAERQPFGIWCYVPGGAASPDAVGEQCYWFDADGVLFEKSLSTQGNLIFVVNDYSQKDRGLGNTVLPAEFNANFVSIMGVMRDTGLGIKEIDLNDLSLEEVDVRTAEGPTIYFSLRFPANDYRSVLKNLIAQGGFDALQYVDCRTEDRVFYK